MSCASATEPARASENETINDVRVSGNELCLLETGNPSGTFERSNCRGDDDKTREHDIPSGNPSGHFITRESA
jgi:hypothetical protein